MVDTKGESVKRRLFIPSGIISLAFLPILSLGYFFSQNGFQQYRTLDFIYLGPKALKRMPPKFRPVLPKREYQVVELSGDAQADRIKLDYVQVFVREMKARKDTLRGIHVVLQDQAKYSSLVRLIDLHNVEKLKYYWVDEKGIWFFVMPDVPLDVAVCGLFNCIVLEEPVLPPWYESYGKQLAILLEVPSLLLLFILLLIVNGYHLLRYSKLKKLTKSSRLV
jgi:hypothetical protein